MPERAQKVLARLGVGSRREAEEWIRAGRLSINGELATLGARVLPGDQMRLDGRLIRQRESAESHTFLCHRSPGEDMKDLLERLPRRSGRRFITVSPMPRIDGGLEVATSDGSRAASLQRAARHWSSEFSVRVRGELPQRALAGILAGTLDRGARLDVERCEPGGGEGTNRWYELTARGGSGKDVRQLFERHGASVSRVLRTRLGTLALERHMPRGRFRALSDAELSSLLPVQAVAHRSFDP